MKGTKKVQKNYKRGGRKILWNRVFIALFIMITSIVRNHYNL